MFLGNEQERKEWMGIDRKYKQTYTPEILKALDKQSVTITMINGFGADNNLKGIPDNNYYWQTVNYLFTKEGSDRIYANNYSGDLNELLPGDTKGKSRPNIDIMIVPNEDLQRYYEARGYITVVFDGIVTIKSLDKLGADITSAVLRLYGSAEANEAFAELLRNNWGKAAQTVGNLSLKQ
jgi:hypothetical protein